jgi:hypothetical protein
MKRAWLSLLLGVFLLEPGNSRATTFLKFDSSYLGDGWFQYHLQMMDDPFFTEVDIGGLQLNFADQIDQSTNLLNWTNVAAPYGSLWTFGQTNPARPYDVTFLVRSSETSYRLGTNGVWDGSSLVIYAYLSGENPLLNQGGGTVYSVSLAGILDLPCLVPCSPSESDGSPTNYTTTIKLLPDVSIQHLIQSDGVAQGVDFLWDYESTFLLQASADLKTWTNVAYVWSDPPETMWTTNVPLNNFGSFYRVELVANDHVSDLPPLNSNAFAMKPAAARKSSAAATQVPRVSGCQMAKGKIAVSLVTEPNQQYTVSAYDNHNAMHASQPLIATGSSATVYFDVKSLPTPVFFQVAPAEIP